MIGIGEPGTRPSMPVVPRRAFVGTVAVGLLMVRTGAHAQTPAKAQRIGWLSGGFVAQRESPNFRAFTQGLGERGHLIGQNVLVDVRSPKSDKIEEYSDLAAELIAGGADVILAANPYALTAVTKATTTVAIVGVDLESDPVAKGWVVSLAHPGRNLTGFFLDIPELSGKLLQFLKEVTPNLARVAVLGDSRVNELQFLAAEASARGAGLTFQRLSVKSLNDIEGAIAEAARERAHGLVALTSPLVNLSLGSIARAAVKHRLPTICPFVPVFAEAGGLLAYGPDFPDLFRRAADYVDRILRGARTHDLPVQRPTKFDLVINLKTARALGLRIPQSLLARADEVIQ